MVTVAFFLVLLVIYAIIAIKIEEWTTIFLLGFRIETPQGFIDRPGIYEFVSRALFGCAGISAMAVDKFRWSLVLITLFILLLAVSGMAKAIGRRRAYKNFRRIQKFLAEDESDPNDRAELEAGARLTDRELKERVDLATKYAI